MVFDAVAQIPYHLVMLYALGSIAVAWSWGGKRGIPDWALGLIGLAVPMGTWVLSAFFSWVALVPAAVQGGLWWWAVEREKSEEAALKSLRDEEREAVLARLADAPDDGAARLALAQSLEREGALDAALVQYEAAHRLSDRMLPEPALAQVRERLAHEREARKSSRAMVLRPLDWIAFAVCAGLLFGSPLRALAAAVAVGFARWLQAAPGRPGSPSF